MRLLGLLALLLPACAHGPLGGRATVVDGDTIDVGGERVRLFGIDAPEREQLCAARGASWRCGEAAAQAMTDLVRGQDVSCARRATDRYGRTVAACTVAGADLGASLVRSGWALDHARYSHGLYAPQQAEAERERRGLWSGEFELPWKWRREHRR